MKSAPESRYRNSMVAVAGIKTQSEASLARLTLFAAGIPHVIAADPMELTVKVLVDPADAADAATLLF